MAISEKELRDLASAARFYRGIKAGLAVVFLLGMGAVGVVNCSAPVVKSWIGGPEEIARFRLDEGHEIWVGKTYDFGDARSYYCTWNELPNTRHKIFIGKLELGEMEPEFQFQQDGEKLGWITSSLKPDAVLFIADLRTSEERANGDAMTVIRSRNPTAYLKTGDALVPK